MPRLECKINSHGLSALNYGAIKNHIQCRILLVEGGASVHMRTKDMHNCFKTPLDMAYSPDFRKGIRQVVSFTTRKTLCIIGNVEGRKSTLTAALQAESSFFLGRIVNCHMQARERMTIANKHLALKQLPTKARSMEKCYSSTLLASMNTMAHTWSHYTKQTRSVNDHPAGGESNRR